jgi:Glycosyl transferase family 11
MIFFRESGRLGNQIFQYAALKTLCQSQEKLVLIGFEEFQEIFEGVDAKIINSSSSQFEKLLYFHILELLPKNALFNKIHESNHSRKPDIIYRSGLLKGFTFVQTSYFQSELLFSTAIVNSLNINQKLLSVAQSLLSSILKGRTPVFVHIRRGDYTYWPSREYPAILPAAYYQKCIQIIQTKITNAFFIFTSDDPFYVKDIFGNMENSYISCGSSLEDFALMTQCRSGILSASSFSWWAAYFSKQQHPSSLFLAPKYWAGHRSERWIPFSIESAFLDYIDV